METIPKKPEIKNMVVGGKKRKKKKEKERKKKENPKSLVEGLTRLDNSRENLWTRRYIWSTDLKCNKEKQGNGKYEKKVKRYGS